MKRETYDLEDRLIDFSVMVINIGETLPKSEAGRYLSGQIIRSGMSPALVYGEAQSAESRKDFIHKISIILKELRETRINMKIILKKGFLKDRSLLSNGLQEVNELISIFAKSLQTAKKNARGNIEQKNI
ncbi:MAG: four helix bundle protein [Melioribacteraceae bacterium]|uniref:four helix bundle protein n=1 Tax=Rhodohalobacter sp. TaxID=1974210 RepID=UPI002ACE3247|nr:four helix bundle protein [Rhodohalobacter sp.]MDZ7756746.1 four helix bundle protein [Rhodohalobacter sp.]MDZ7767126.1 four helix bundle protein [Melioribacteraceae bacterium]